MKRLVPVLALCALSASALRAAAPEPEKPVENPKPKLKFTPTPKADDDTPDIAGTPPATVIPPASADEQIRDMRRRMREQMRALTGDDPAFAELDRMFDAMNGPGLAFPGTGAPDVFAQTEARMREALKQMKTLRGASGNGTTTKDSGWKTVTKTLPGGGTITIRTRTETFGSATKTPAHPGKADVRPDEGAAVPDADNTVILPPAPKAERAEA